MKVAIIDNYDSFTYNLNHILCQIGVETTVLRNDSFRLEELETYDKLVLSPGPGIPSEAGLLIDVIRTYAQRKPILGVCLGHQAIGEVFGAHLTNLSHVFHGIQSPVSLTGDDYLFNGLPDSFLVGRYHSWVIERKDLPPCLEVTAVSQEGQIMAIRHRHFDVHGIQFHPESILTPEGQRILTNFLMHPNRFSSSTIQ